MKKKIIGIIIVLLGILLITNKCSSNMKNYSTYIDNKHDYYIIVDYSIHPGKYRFFVFDNKGKCILKSLCEQGKGVNKFSNKIGSNYSSLGKFKVKGFNIMSNNLPSFLLEGLDSSNSNAKKRQILIHPYYTVPDFEIFSLKPITTSKGCFIISPIKFKLLQYYISNKKVVLYSIK